MPSAYPLWTSHSTLMIDKNSVAGCVPQEKDSEVEICVQEVLVDVSQDLHLWRK